MPHAAAPVASGGDTADAGAPNHDSVLPNRVGTAVTVLAALATVAVLFFGRDIFVPFALAALLGFMLDPLVTRLRRWGLPRTGAVVLVMVATVAVLGASSVFVGSQVVALSKALPTYQSTVQHKLRALRQQLSGRGVLDDASRMLDVVGTELDAARRAVEQAAHRSTPPATRVQVEPAPRSALQTLGDVAAPVLGPLATAGIVLVFVVLILLERHDMRDRLLRLVGGDLHQTTDALNEAADRVSRYLTMQWMVNLSYGVPMAVGLTLIGVPGAVLWGVVAAVMRFVPYIGPVIAAVFPLTLAFAVDPGWSMVLWALGLVLTLELISNNVIEPWLYGASTGLSAVSIIVSAVFWTALWGPIGLVLATPLTVCLAVLGRHLPALAWLDVLLGNAPAFDPPTRLYQRLLAGDVEEAIDLAGQQAQAEGPAAFYNSTAVPALRQATQAHSSVASVEHRHRMATGMATLVRELREEYPATLPGSAGTSAGLPVPDAPAAPAVLCIGARWEVDTLAADMLAHALALAGHPARALPASAVGAANIGTLALDGVQAVCLSYFSPTPEAHVRYVARRLKRRQPGLQVLVALWNAPPALLAPETAQALGVDAVAHSLAEAVVRLQALPGHSLPGQHPPATAGGPLPANEAQRLQALADSGALDAAMRAPFDRAAQRAADVFDAPLAMVSLVNDRCQVWHGAAGLDPHATESSRTSPRDGALCAHVVALDAPLVVEDTARDPRFAGHAGLQTAGVRFYAGVPLRPVVGPAGGPAHGPAPGPVIGALCVMDRRPRSLSASELQLLEAMAADLMATLADTTAGRQGKALLPLAQAADGGLHLSPATPA